MIKIQLRINVKLFPVIIFKVTNEDVKTYFHDFSNAVILDKKKRKKEKKSITKFKFITNSSYEKRGETLVWERTKIFPVFPTRNKSRKSTYSVTIW